MKYFLVLCVLCINCVGGFGSPVYETVGSGISISFDYSHSEELILDSGDGAFMNGGFMGLGLNSESVNNPSVSELVSIFAAQNEIVYVTSHGSGGGISFPGGIIRPETYSVYEDNEEVETGDVSFGMRFLVIATCLAGRTNWEDALMNNPNLDGVFAYTKTTYDELDNNVAADYIICLDSYDIPVNELTPTMHSECWQEANISAGGNFKSSFVSIIRSGDEIIRIGN